MPTYIVRVSRVSRPNGMLSKVVTESMVFVDYHSAKVVCDEKQRTEVAGPDETCEVALEVIPEELYNKDAPKG